MKAAWLAGVLSLLTAAPAAAASLGVSMAMFDDPFLTNLRTGMQDYAKSKTGVTLQIVNAQNGVDRQLRQIHDFIDQKVDAIIVNAVDTDTTPKITALAAGAGMPLVYVNRLPADAKLPPKTAFVGSDEHVSGTLEAQEVCRLLGGKGVIAVLMGELSNQAARQRTADVEDVLKSPDCTGIKLLDKQTANWNRTQASDLVGGWLGAGLAPDAIIANNDEMAIGAIEALKAAAKPIGVGHGKTLVAGIDATQAGLAAMKAGDLAVTVFQDAAGQGKGAVDTALKLAAGEKTEQIVWVKLTLVTPATMDRFLGKN